MAKGYLYDNGDELITREDVNEVPDSSTAQAGDVLGLDSNKKPKWTTPESGLPDTTSASAGDVLSLDSDKEPVWSAPSGGGSGKITVSTTSETLDISGSSFTVYPCDKTYSEIVAMINAGILPFFVSSDGTETFVGSVVSYRDNLSDLGSNYHYGITDSAQLMYISNGESNTLYHIVLGN